MQHDIAKKLEELGELRKLSYVSEEEYAVARENILLDAGFDIHPRSENPGPGLPPPPAPAPRKRGCGCFLLGLLLLLLVLAGSLFAVPQEVLRSFDIPALRKILDSEEFLKVHNAFIRFIGDLRGLEPASRDRPPLPEPSVPEERAVSSEDASAAGLVVAEPVPEDRVPPDAETRPQPQPDPALPFGNLSDDSPLSD